MAKFITIGQIENGYIVQIPPAGYPHECKIEYAKNLDGVFAIVERLFEENAQKDKKGDE